MLTTPCVVILTIVVFAAFAGTAPPIAPATSASVSAGAVSGGIAVASAIPSASPGSSAALTQDEIRSAAARAYLAAVTAYNKANGKLATKYKTFGSAARARDYFAAAAKLTGALMKATRAIVFPADSAADAHVVLTKLAAKQALEISGSAVKNLDQSNVIGPQIDKVSSAIRAASDSCEATSAFRQFPSDPGCLSAERSSVEARDPFDGPVACFLCAGANDDARTDRLGHIRPADRDSGRITGADTGANDDARTDRLGHIRPADRDSGRITGADTGANTVRADRPGRVRLQPGPAHRPRLVHPGDRDRRGHPP